MISVTIDSPNPDIGPHWDDLVRRASSNVFMNPAALQAACATDFASIEMLLAWEEDGRRTQARRRLGAAVYARSRRSGRRCWKRCPTTTPFCPAPWSIPPMSVTVIPAFFAAIEKSPSLPDVVSLHVARRGMSELSGDAAGELAVRGVAPLMLSASARPFVTREFGVKRSGSTRKKLRQDWNRLSALGTVDVVNDRTPTAPRRHSKAFWRWKRPAGRAIGVPRCCPIPATPPSSGACFIIWRRGGTRRSRCCGSMARPSPRRC